MRQRETALQRDITRLEQKLRQMDKREASEALSAGLPPLDDDTLATMYQELLEAPADTSRPLSLPRPSRKDIRLGLAQKLGLPAPPSEPDTERAGTDVSVYHSDAQREWLSAVLARLTDAVASPAPGAAHAAPDAPVPTTDTADQNGGAAVSAPDTVPKEPPRAAPPTLSPDEWLVLAGDSARANDGRAVSRVLSLALRHGMELRPLFHRAMDAYALRGDLAAVQHLSDAMTQSTYQRSHQTPSPIPT